MSDGRINADGLLFAASILGSWAKEGASNHEADILLLKSQDLRILADEMDGGALAASMDAETLLELLGDLARNDEVSASVMDAMRAKGEALRIISEMLNTGKLERTGDGMVRLVRDALSGDLKCPLEFD